MESNCTQFWFEYHYRCCYWCNIFKWYVLLYSTEVLGAMATTGLLAEGGSACVLAAGVALLFKSAEIAVQNSNSGWQWSSGSDLTKRYEKSDNGKTGFLKSIDLTNELYQRNTLSSIDFEAYHYNMLGVHLVTGTGEFGLAKVVSAWNTTEYGDEPQDHFAVVLHYVSNTRWSGKLILTNYGSMHQVARLFASNESDSSNTPRSDIYWVTYDWDGFNENLLRQYWTNLDDENITSQQNSIKQQIDYYNSRDDYAVSKICMPLGSGDAIGQNTILLGETYANQFGGVDGECELG